MNSNFKEESILKLNKDLEVIVKELLQVFGDNMISAILYGSYGRNEGAFFYKERQLFTYNDYDLMIVIKKKVDYSILKKIRIKLESILQIKWIDLSQITSKKLKKLKPTIFNYDLKYGSKVILGDPNMLDLIPKLLPKQITLRDAEVLFFTRLYTFLGSLGENGFKDGVKGEQARFFRNQMAKAVLAIVDTLLIQKESYDSSYKKRVRLLSKFYPERIKLIELAEWALDEKMNPKDIALSDKETENLYQEVLDVFFKEMKIALSKLYKVKINNMNDFKKAKSYSSAEFVIRLKDLILSRSISSYTNKINIQFAQAYLAEAYISENKKKNQSIQKAANLISGLEKDLDNSKMEWNELRLLICKLRMSI
jgi:hypothetical protein